MPSVPQFSPFLPAAFIVLDNVLTKQDGRIEEAAASQGATAWQVFLRVTLPMAQPGLVRSFVIVFMLIMTDFGNPLIIGKDIPEHKDAIVADLPNNRNKFLAAALASRG